MSTRRREPLLSDVVNLTLSFGGLGCETHLGCAALVSEELWVHAAVGLVSLALGFLDSKSVRLSGLVVCRMVL